MTRLSATSVVHAARVPRIHQQLMHASRVHHNSRTTFYRNHLRSTRFCGADFGFELGVDQTTSSDGEDVVGGELNVADL